MYAHMVIDYLGDLYLESIEKQHLNTRGIKELILSIAQAQHFHFFSLNEILDMTMNPDDHLFKGKTKEYARLPYPLLWIDFDYYDPYCSDRKRKAGVLAQEIDKNAFRVLSFCDRVEEPELKIPVPDPCSFIVDLNTEEIGIGYGADPWSISFKGDIVNILNGFPEQIRKYHRELIHNLYPLNACLMLLNCKNIVTEEHHPPEKINKKRRSLGRQELFTYKTLRVVLPSRSRSADNPSKTDIHQRIHLCRGHFKVYTAENPLFGKHTGLYWWQPHVRGQNKDGIVMKDYDIEKRKT
jgi:hypothetical protein